MNSLRFRPRLETLESRDCPAVLLVTSGLDDGSAGTLRYEMAQARSHDFVELTVPVSLTSEIYMPPSPYFALTILPTGQRQTIIGDGVHRLFDVGLGNFVTFENLNLTGGGGVGSVDTGFGGAVFNDGTVSFRTCDIYGNTDQANGGGGAIASIGEQFKFPNGQTAFGGYVYMTGTSVYDNTDIGIGGGAVYMTHGTYGSNLILSGSTITANSSPVIGGGVYNDMPFDNIIVRSGSSIVGNSAPHGTDVETLGGINIDGTSTVGYLNN